MSKTQLSLTLFISLVLAAVPASAQPDEDKTKDDDESSSESSNEIGIGLDEAVAAAIKFHPDVAGIEVDTEIARTEAKRVDARFSPVITVTASGRRQDLYNEFATDSESAVASTSTLRGDLGIAGKTRFGTSYELLFSNTRQTSAQTSPLSALSPRYQSELSARVTQPLLRDAWGTANRGLIERETLNAASVEASGRERLKVIVLDVVTTYWGLALRIQEVSIARANLEAATKLREVVVRRVQAGKDARTSLIQADASVAERRRVLETARVNVVEAERLFLGVSYLSRARKISAKESIVSSDKPGEAQKLGSYKKELATALANRPEIVAAERALRLAELDEKIAKNSQRMRLDLYGVAGLGGLAGASKSATAVDEIDGGFGKAASNLVGVNAPFYEIGVLLEIPLNNGDRAGSARQARLTTKKRRAVDAKTQVSLDVRAAIQRVSISRNRLQVADDAVELAEKNVGAQTRRYEGGGTTLFEVLRSQDELSAANATRALAQAQVEVAHASLEAARGTLLRRFGANAK